MPSLQEPAGGAKSAKFVNANPLEPMIDPFSQLNDEQTEAQQILTENVNERLERALGELRVKHEKGTNDIDDPNRAPTGLPYQQVQAQQRLLQQQQQQQQQQLQQQQQKQQQHQQHIQHLQKLANIKNNFSNNEDDDDEDSDYDDLLDDDIDNDPIVEQIRLKRIEEMKKAQLKHAENIGKGHGQYRTISQDEFLNECNGSSEFVIIHFYHDEFQRCKIIDYHLKILAPIHTSAKFLRIDSTKTPFFVSKLNIKTLPTIIVFRDGISIARLIGFQDLITLKHQFDEDHNVIANNNYNNIPVEDADSFTTTQLQLWLANTGAIELGECSIHHRRQLEQSGLVSTAAAKNMEGATSSYANGKGRNYY